jgi:DNA repair exonuclease SbcCD ATPase subunit
MMNLAGKILIVALFVMSMMFATFSIMVYASHRNWKEEIQRATPVGGQDVGLNEQYKRKTVENEHLTTQRNNLEEQLLNEKAAKIQALTRLEAMSVALNAEYAAKAEQLKTNEAQLVANTTKLHTSESELAKLTSEVNDSRGKIARSQDETKAQINRSIKLNDKLATATGQLAVLQERNEQLNSDVKQAQQRGGPP